MVKEGGGDLNFNLRFRFVIEKVKVGNMLKDILERVIKKGFGELEGVDFIEMRYEGYGFVGIVFIVEVVIDNKNRIVLEMRMIFICKDGNFGVDGVVFWMFKKKGVIIVKVEGIDVDEFMMVVLEVGVEDVIEDDGYFEVIIEYIEF